MCNRASSAATEDERSTLANWTEGSIYVVVCGLKLGSMRFKHND